LAPPSSSLCIFDIATEGANESAADCDQKKSQTRISTAKTLTSRSTACPAKSDDIFVHPLLRGDVLMPRGAPAPKKVIE